MDALNSLIEHWRLFEQSDDSFVHRRDRPFQERGLDAVHTDIAPYPFVGNLRRADVWLLMLNSKLGPNDVREEGEEPYHTLFWRNLKQDFSDQEYPLISLDPSLEGTGTYQYYNRTRGLAALIKALSDRANITLFEARRMLSQRLAIVELLPYRSSTFPRNLRQLPSVNLARAAAREAALTKLLVVPWGIEAWGLQSGPSVLHRPARTFSFAPGGASGYCEGILNHLIES